MAFRSTPQLGPQLDDVFVGLPYWDTGNLTSPSYQLGNVEKGIDGHDYVWVQASANIASGTGNGTQVALTLPAGTAATGTGGWYAPPGVAVASGSYFHARRGALGTI